MRIKTPNTRTMTVEQYIAHIRSHTVFADNGCWLYQGRQNGDGYCQVVHHGKRHQLTRLMYTLIVGPIPPKRMMCHKCDTPNCWNPEHLYPGTFSDNMADCINRHRHAYQNITTCKHGHPWNEANTRLSAAGKRNCRECERIRQRIASGWPKELAKSLPPGAPGYSPINPNYRRAAKSGEPT